MARRTVKIANTQQRGFFIAEAYENGVASVNEKTGENRKITYRVMCNCGAEARFMTKSQLRLKAKPHAKDGEDAHRPKCKECGTVFFAERADMAEDPETSMPYIVIGGRLYTKLYQVETSMLKAALVDLNYQAWNGYGRAVKSEKILKAIATEFKRRHPDQDTEIDYRPVLAARNQDEQSMSPLADALATAVTSEATLLEKAYEAAENHSPLPDMPDDF